MRENKFVCPCKKLSCEHHGDCTSCREKHRANTKYLPACDRVQLRATKKSRKK